MIYITAERLNKPGLHYNVLGTARLALGTVPLCFGTALHIYTYLFAALV